MAETEVSKEVSKVVGIEEKYRLDMSSHQDLPKPDCNGHNQANDLDNSYVFVTGDDAVGSEGSNVSPELKAVVTEDQGAKLDPENEKLDAVNGEVRELLNVRENGNGELSNGDPPVEDEVKQVKDSDGNMEAAAVEKVVDQNGEIEGVDADEEEKFDDLLKSESSTGPEESEVRALVMVAESGENGGLKTASSHIDSSVDSKDESQHEINLSAIGTLEARQGSEDVDCDMQDVSMDAKDKVKLEQEVVEALDLEHEVPPSASSDLESSPIDNKEETRKEESRENGGLNVNNSDIVNDKCEGEINLSVVEGSEASQGSTDEVANAADCELQDVSMDAKDGINIEREMVESAEPEVPPSTSSDLDLELSPINNFGNANDECEDQINLSVIETSEACQGSADVVANVVKCDVDVEADNGVILEREEVETVEHEVPASISLDLDLDLDLKSYPINNKDETLKEESGENGGLNIISSNINNSGNTNDEIEDQVELSVTEALEASQGIKDAVVNVADCELPDVSMETKVDTKLERELVETAENEVLTSTSLDLESYPINNNEEKLEEGKTTLSSAVLEDQQCDTALDNNVQGVLEQIGEAKNVMTNTDSHVETVRDLVLEENDKEDFFVSRADNSVQYPEEPDKHLDSSGVSSESMLSETKAQVSVPTSNDYEPQTKLEISDAETIGTVSSSPDDGRKSQIVSGSGSDSTLDMVVLAGKEPTFQEGVTDAETEVLSEKAKVADRPPETFDVKLEPEVRIHDFSTISSVEMTSNATQTEVSDHSSNVKKEGAANVVSEIEEGAPNTALEIEDVEDMGDQLDGAAGSSNENLFLQENGDTLNSHSNGITVASSLGGSLMDGEAASVKIKTKPFNFLIRTPRFDDETLREQIRLAKLHVDEKTKMRDAVQVQIQEKRANSQIHGMDYEYAKSEGRSARKLVRSKRMEIDNLQSVINKAKNALSIEDIDSQIHNMEHMIQHETLPLKEEKHLIREIKQLKQLREQLSSNMGSLDEIKQALEQREEVEERLKILRKELDILKGRALKTEAVALEAEKKYDDENKKVKELQTQFRAADDVRQEAYAQWQNLRKELSKKSKHFYKYKDDAALASNFAFARDTEALYRLCVNHVENFMELWNTNDEFRRDYIRFNTRSTVRRFGTLDGRSLGPDEEPFVLPSYVDERVKRLSTPVKVDLASQIPTPEVKQETTSENVVSEGKLTKEVTEHKNQKVINKGPAIAVQVNGLSTVSGREFTDEVHEEPKKSRDEIEAIRKAEEVRREEVEAKLKEQHRLEVLAKANEARERKKRQAEKLQMRAELKTQKEAEQREKEREKRLRKKERKKAAATDINDINNNCEAAPSSESTTLEISKDTEVKDTSSVTPKKPQKSWLFTKHSKSKSVPPPLRNRNKKKLQQWMWVGITCVVILLLFWLGNIGVFSNINLKRRSPAH